MKMTVELLQNLSFVSYIIAGILLLLSIALFFLLDVPGLYGDVSGHTAKKAIEAIQHQNEETENKTHKPGAVNEAQSKLTDKITSSGQLESSIAGMPISVRIEKFVTSKLAPQSNETTILSEPAGKTTVLTGTPTINSGETALLDYKMEKKFSVTEEDKFIIEIEMSFTESSEIIE